MCIEKIETDPNAHQIKISKQIMIYLGTITQLSKKYVLIRVNNMSMSQNNMLSKEVRKEYELCDSI